MREPWLVQTGKFINNPENPRTIDDIIELKYMGAAEFEMELVYENGKNELKNPLFLSIKRMAKSKKEYDFIKLPKRKDAANNQMYIYCKVENAEEYKEFVRQMIKKENCKRATLLPRYYNLTKDEIEYGNFINFWWDIKNDFFIFFGDEKIELFKTIFDAYDERFHDEFYPPTKMSKLKKFLKRNFNISHVSKENSVRKQFNLFGITLFEKNIELG